MVIIRQEVAPVLILEKIFSARETLKGYFTSRKMNVYLKWVNYVEEM